MAIAIIGMGYVGLPLALTFAEAGHEVFGIDTDFSKMIELSENRSYLSTVSSKRLEASEKLLCFSCSYKTAQECTAFIICVPTPLDKNNLPDLSAVQDAVTRIKPFLKKGDTIILESTVYPGATEEIADSILETTNFNIGVDVFLCYSPEREDPGNKSYSTKTIPKLIAGYTPECLQKGLEIYRGVIDTLVQVENLKTAEFAKLLENVFRSVNIALVNELKLACDKITGINIHKAIEAAATKPFGFMPFYPGPGIGGHCLPIDPLYLTYIAKKAGAKTHFIDLASEVNSSMPALVCDKVVQALNDNGLALRGAMVLVLGVTYKKNIGDWRESPAEKIIGRLLSQGAQVFFEDPFIESDVFCEAEARNFGGRKGYGYFDVCVMLTDHDAFDKDLIFAGARLIVDTRNVFPSAVTVYRA